MNFKYVFHSLALIFSLDLYAQLHSFSNGNVVDAAKINENFIEIKSKLTNPNMSLNFSTFNSGSLISKENINLELQKLNSLGLSVPLIQSESIKSSEMNASLSEAFSSIESLNEAFIFQESARVYFDGTMASSCKEYRSYISARKSYYGTRAASGIYKISISGSPKIVYCDMESEGGGWTLVASGWIPSYDSLINSSIKSLGQFINSGSVGQVPSFREMRHFCRRSNSVIVHRKRTTPSDTQNLLSFSVNNYSNTDSLMAGHNSTVAANWEINGSYAELHYYSPNKRFIIRPNQIHCNEDYSIVGGDNNNAILGQEAYIYIR